MTSPHQQPPRPDPVFEAEAYLLAAFLSDGTDPALIPGMITEEDFSDGSPHRLIMRAILAVCEVGEKPDYLRVLQELGFMGHGNGSAARERCISLGSTVALFSEAEEYSRIVRAHAVRRKLIYALEMGIALAKKQPPQTVIGTLETQLSALQDRAAQDIMPIGQFSEAFEARLAEIEAGNPGLLGLPTGFKDLDAVTGGLVGGELMILAARPGMGKTAFAMETLFSVASSEGPGLMVSLEMGGAAIYNRLACSLGRVDLLKIRRGFLSAQEIHELRVTSAAIKQAPFYLIDSGTIGTDLLALKTMIRKGKRKVGIKIVVIDYLQLISIRGHRGNRENEVSTISRELKQLSRELDIPIVALSQLSRSCEGRENKRPMLSDLRESGAIEQDADSVLFLYRDYYYNRNSREPGVCEGILAKQRNGPPCTVKFAFEKTFARFGTLDQSRRDEEPAEESYDRTW